MRKLHYLLVDDIATPLTDTERERLATNFDRLVADAALTDYIDRYRKVYAAGADKEQQDRMV